MRAIATTAAVLVALLAGASAGTAATPDAAATTTAATTATVTTAALPSGTTTGVTTAALTPMAGGTVTTSGTTISGRVITGDVLFTGSNLTLRDVRVTGEAIFRGDGLVIEDSEFGALSLSGTAGVRISGVDVFGALGKDGMHITSDSGRVSDVVVEDTWIHGPTPLPTSHYDGIQVRGVDRLTLRRVAVDLGAFAPQHNAALFLEGANGGNHGVTVESSSLRGGGYALYTFADDVRVRGSVIGGGNWGHLFPASPAEAIVEFAGNADTTGQALGLGTVDGRPALVPVTDGSAPPVADAGPGDADPAAERTVGGFWDVGAGHPFAASIGWLVEQRVADGYDDGSFRPAAAVTRQAMAAFLHRFAGRPAVEAPTTSPFVDVPTSHPFYAEIAWLHEQGISTGTVTPAGLEFRPDEPVTRQAMAAFLHRAAGEPAATASGAFADVGPGSAFAAEIAWLAGTGISTGSATSSGVLFKPAAPVTRDAMAAFLQRARAGGHA